MKNKILLLVKLPPPITGATLMNKYVADSTILKDNFNIKTIAVSYNKSVKKMGNLGILKLLKIFEYSYKLIKQLIIFKPKLVYFQISPLGSAFIRDSFYVLIIKLFRKRIVFHIHGKGIANQVNNPIKRMLYISVFRNQQVITLSPLLDYDVKDVYNGLIYNVPNGIPIVNINIHEKPVSDKVNILFLSNLIISKGIIDYIEAIKLLSKRNQNFKAFIVGNESNLTKEELQEIISSNKLDNYLEYLGPKYGEEKYKILTDTDILIFPTTNDIWGNVNLEAMQCSVPVIATNEGAIPEIIDDGITGFIVDKNSPEQIAEKIEYLINNPEKRIEMGKAGRKKFLEKYTIDKFEENMKNVFSDILDKIEKQNNKS